MFIGLVVKWREFNGERKFVIAFYAIATWVICLLERKPEQSHIRYLTILCMSAEGFSGLLADGKCSTKNLLGGLC